MGVPKIIHQMWLSKDGNDVSGPLTKSYRKNTEDLIRLHPDYQYMWWDNTKTEEVFNHPKLQKYKECFLNLKPHICRCDFARYALLYLHGGIYFDLDFKFYQHIPDELLDTDLLLFHEPDFPCNFIPDEFFKPEIFKSKRSLANNILASAPYNDFWLHLMDKVVAIYQKQAETGVLLCTSINVLNTTGPRMITREVSRYLQSNPNASHHLETDCGLFFGPLTQRSIAFNDWSEGTNWQLKTMTETPLGETLHKSFVLLCIFVIILAIVLVGVVAYHFAKTRRVDKVYGWSGFTSGWSTSFKTRV